MRILVTGGAGYLGSILVPTLLSAGHAVTVLDNFMYRQNSLLDCCHYPDLKIIRGDARDEAVLKKLMDDSDIIIPLACLTGAPLCEKEPKEAEEIILNAVELIINLLHSDQKIIYPTTNSGYGVGEKGKFCTEESPLRPVSLYGKLKVQAETKILEAGNAITLRLATAFGISPRMRFDLLVNDFTYRAVTDGKLELFEAHFMRNYIHVCDIAKAFLHSIENFESMKNQAYNVGLSEANCSKKELCQKIQEQVSGFTFSETMNAKDPDQRDYIVSNEKIEQTGFTADVSLSAGIAELIKGYTILDNNREVCVRLTNV